MSSQQPVHVAETLAFLEEQIVSPRTIDAATHAGVLSSSDIVMTSMGNVRRAVITPHYPRFQFENNIFHRVKASADLGRPLIEAGLTLRKHRSGGVAANVVIRYCGFPELDEEGEVTVAETAASYPIDPTQEDGYGTMDKLVKQIYMKKSWGQELMARSGYVYVSPNVKRRHGKWAISEHAEGEGHARYLRYATSRFHEYKRPFR